MQHFSFIFLFLIVQIVAASNSPTAHASADFSEKPAQTLKAYNGETLQVSVVTPQQANWLFTKLKSQSSIPYAYLVNGCHVRAQQMVDIAEVYNFKMAKAIIEADETAGLITFYPRNTPWRIKWTYHMAPALFVRDASGQTKAVVIDPSLFSGPISLKQWQAKVLRDSSPAVRQTAQKYFVSQYTFRPDLKEQVFSRLPRWLDRNISSFLSQFAHDLERFGRYNEKCITVSDHEKTVGGVAIDELPMNLVRDLPYCDSL